MTKKNVKKTRINSKYNNSTKGKIIRKITAWVLLLCMIMGSLTGIMPAQSVTRVKAAYTITNPRVSNGVSTWDCIYFGNYWQEDTNGDGKADRNDAKQPIKWRVLSVDGDDAFLLADMGLDCQPYYKTYTRVTWETCTLRSWLNNDFYNNAFNSSEKSAIRTTNVINADNPNYGTDGGNNTSDKVYLLSIAEASNSAYGFDTEFSSSSKTRQSKITAYAKGQGAYVSSIYDYAGNGYWWLRSPGFISKFAAHMFFDGSLRYEGLGVHNDDKAIRPALHINLSSSTWKYAGTVNSDGTESGVVEDPEIESDIVKKVKLYTSDAGSSYTQVYMNLMNRISRDNIPKKQAQQMLRAFYTDYGYSSIREGLDYAKDTLYAKQAYDYLTNDEVYLHYQYGWWLNHTTKGKTAKKALIADGLIFNGDLFAGLNPSTWINNNLPVVKTYKSMLSEFIEEDIQRSEADTIGKNILKFIGSINDINRGELEKEINSLKNKPGVTDSDYLKILGKYRITDSLKEVEDGVYEIKTTTFQHINKCVKHANLTFTVMGDVYEDIMDIITLESRMEVVNRYMEFLNYIEAGADYLPYGMVIAAQQIKEETFKPVQSMLKKITGQISDFIVDNVVDFEEYTLAAAEGVNLISTTGSMSISAFLGTFKLASYIVDKLTGIGSLVKASACTEAYANLGIYFSDILEEKKEEFNKNQTEENAIAFYNVYQTLFRIRYMGELQYLKMNEDRVLFRKAINAVGYEYTSIMNLREYIEQEFDYMNTHCYFGLDNADAIADTIMYAQKAAISCPVNIEIYDKRTGEVVYIIKDGSASDITNEYGHFISEYNPVNDDYRKLVYLNDSDNYGIRACAVDAGGVSIITSNYDEEGNSTQIVQLSNVGLYKNGTIDIENNDNSFNVDRSGDGNDVNSIEGSELDNSQYVPVTGVTLSESSLELKEGDISSVSVNIAPANATISDLEWSSSDETVAVVVNGKITALKEGEASIYVKSKDGAYTAACGVKVSPNDTEEVDGKRLINNCVIECNERSVLYDGSAKTLELQVFDNETELLEGEDYELRYTNNISIGTAFVTVYGIGNYTGTNLMSFSIIGNCDILGHSYDDGTVIKEESCKEDGRIVYHCQNCSETIEMVQNRYNHIDLDSDNICDICGEVVYEASVYAYNLTTTGRIGINTYMRFSDKLKSEAQNGMVKMIYTLPDGTKTECIPEAKELVVDSENGDKETFYKFTANVAAKEMRKTVEGELYCGDEFLGNYPCSVENYYNLVKQAYENDNSRYPETYALMTKMMKYGDDAAIYLNQDEVQSSEDLSDEEQSDLNNYNATVEGTDTLVGIEYKGASLILEDQTTIRHYFTLNDGVDISDLTAMIDESEATILKSEKYAGYYYVDISNITARNLNRAYKLVISNSSESFAVTYSALTYANKAFSRESSSEALKNLAKSLYRFSVAAGEYTKWQ